MAQLVSATPRLQSNGDWMVMLEDIKPLLEKDIEALVLRTLPNISDKLHKAYSGTNPTYVEPALTAYLRENNIKHFLLDLPSVDREEDEGKLEAHHAFWNYPSAPRLDATITEFIYVKDEIQDGRYLLNLQIASFESDASPSKPVLYAIK
jgi:kynurenine formamidase